MHEWSTLDGHDFQSFCADLLRASGFEVESRGVGPDGGVDLIATFTSEIHTGLSTTYRWAVQAKHRQTRSRAVGPAELGNITNVLARFQADGFMLMTNGRVTAKAFDEIRSISSLGPPRYLTDVWDGARIRSSVARLPAVGAAYGLTGRTVLVVDDTETWGQILGSFVETGGDRAIGARNLREAMRLIDNVDIDLAILDIRLVEADDADRSGVTVADYLEATQPGTPVLFITGHASTGMLRELANRASTIDSLAKADADLKSGVDSALIETGFRSINLSASEGDGTGYSH